MWPVDAQSLIELQLELAQAAPRPWRPATGELRIGGCWVCFPRGLNGPGRAGDVAWAAAVLMRGGAVLDREVRRGVAGAPYSPGLLARRIGGLMEATVRSCSTPVDVLLLDATARDHPRGAGLALHLGAELDLPTVGVTHRPLLARGEWPADRRGDTSPLWLGDTRGRLLDADPSGGSPAGRASGMAGRSAHRGRGGFQDYLAAPHPRTAARRTAPGPFGPQRCRRSACALVVSAALRGR